MDEKKEVKRITPADSATMPEPQIIDYSAAYKFSDAFIRDLKISLGDIAYVQAVEYLDFVEKNKNGLYVAKLNEFVAKLGHLPYRYVASLMDNIRNPKVQSQYFIKLTENK